MHEVPIDLTKATTVAPSVDDGSAGWTTRGRIPDAAVEAAAIEWVGKHNWENCKPEWKIDYLTRAHAGLVSAAPHMLASAWDAGWDTFADFDSRPGGPYPTNPYTPTP